MPDKEPQRAVIEYRETPTIGKPRVVNRVIEDAVDGADVYKKFWDSRVWPAMIRKIEILSIRWPEEE